MVDVLDVVTHNRVLLNASPFKAFSAGGGVSQGLALGQTAGQNPSNRGLQLVKDDVLVITVGMASKPRTTGVAQFDPDTFFASWADGKLPRNNQFRASIISTFELPDNDSYVYHAIASVTLAQVQEAINHGGESGLHAWYLDDSGKPVIPPTTGRDSSIA